MTKEQAVSICKAHQAWRRDRSDEGLVVMQSPYEVGIALDILIAIAEEQNPFLELP